MDGHAKFSPCSTQQTWANVPRSEQAREVAHCAWPLRARALMLAQACLVSAQDELPNESVVEKAMRLRRERHTAACRPGGGADVHLMLLRLHLMPLRLWQRSLQGRTVPVNPASGSQQQVHDHDGEGLRWCCLNRITTGSAAQCFTWRPQGHFCFNTLSFRRAIAC